MKKLLHVLTGSALAAVVLAAGIQTVEAADPSAPYRNYPGFTCYKWNHNKECVDFTYYNTGASSSYYSSTPYYTPTPVSSRSDVTVRIEASDDEFEPGDTVTYSIYLKNNGSTSRTVDVLAELDSDLTFRSASNDGEDDDEEVEWEDIRLSARGSKTLTLKARLDSSADDGDELTTSVEVTGSGVKTITDEVDIEVDDDNNSNDDDDDCYYYSNGRWIYDEDECDNDNDDDDEEMVVRIIGSPSRVEAGGTITYQIQVRNEGRSDEYVDIEANLDEDTIFLSASDNGDDSRDLVEWDRIFIRRDETRTVQVTVRADRSLDDGDTVTITAEAGNDEDEETTKIFKD